MEVIAIVSMNWLVAALGHGARAAILMMGACNRRGNHLLGAQRCQPCPFYVRNHMTHNDALRDHNNSKPTPLRPRISFLSSADSTYRNNYRTF